MHVSPAQNCRLVLFTHLEMQREIQCLTFLRELHFGISSILLFLVLLPALEPDYISSIKPLKYR